MQAMGLRGVRHQQAPPQQSLQRVSPGRLAALPSLELLPGFDEAGLAPFGLPGESQAFRSSPGLLPGMSSGQQNQLEGREQQQLPVAHRRSGAAPHLPTSSQPRNPASGYSVGLQSTIWRSSQPSTDCPPLQHGQQPRQPAPLEQQSAVGGQGGGGDYLSQAMFEVMGPAGGFDFSPAALQQQVGAPCTTPVAPQLKMECQATPLHRCTFGLCKVTG